MRPALQLPARIGEEAHLLILTTPRSLPHVRLKIGVFGSIKPPLSPGKWMTRVLPFVNGWTVRLGYRGSGLLRGSCQMLATGVQCPVSYCHALDFHTSLQPSPLLVSRRPKTPPEGVGPCSRRSARSSRRGGVEIDGAKVPRRSRRRPNPGMRTTCSARTPTGV